MNTVIKPLKVKCTFSLSADTVKKLEEYARKYHTNKSQAVTDLIWNASRKNYGNCCGCCGCCDCGEHIYINKDFNFEEFLKNVNKN